MSDRMSVPTPLDLHPEADTLRKKAADKHHHHTTLGHIYTTAREVHAAYYFFTQKGIDPETAVELTHITLNHPKRN